MILNYNDYLKEEKALTLEEMQSIHEDMISEIGADADAMELYEDLLEKAIPYAAVRAEWFLMDYEKRMEIDDRRTSLHNSVITHLNMLSRYLKMQGKEAKWRDRLGYEEDDRYYRKSMGDFACYLAFINGIHAR